MDPVTFGKKIKQYYPQYTNIDDALLGQKYLQKYGPAIESLKGGFQTLKDLPEKQQTAIGAFGKEIGLEPIAAKENRPAEIVAKEEGRKLLSSAAQDALNSLDQYRKQGKDVTGITQTAFRKYREQLGLVSPESVDFQARLGNVGATYAFSTGGKQFTETELRLISPLLPEPEEDEKVIERKLKTLIGILSTLDTKRPDINSFNR